MNNHYDFLNFSLEMHKLCHMETFDYAMCHNIWPFKIIIIMKKNSYFFFENAQIMPREKIDLAMCINIKASIMDDRD